MPLTTSRRTAQIHMPPIHSIMSKVRKLRESNREIYSMAQAVPWYDPPHQAVEAMKLKMGESNFHFYSPDPGLMSTRVALAREISRRRGIALNPASELHLTCGASQAFVSSLMAVADPGDRVVVLEPYYFDHVFAIQFSNLELDSIPMNEDTRWNIPWKKLEKKIPGARVMVLVNPGNPTGASLSESEIRRIVKLTGENHCMLIIDETYERFNFTGSKYHPWMETAFEHVITIGSFSKSFSLSGWRLGYLFGADCILEQALKVQDSVVICPSTPGQILLEQCLNLDGWVENRANEVEYRLNLCREAMGQAEGLDWREAEGGFFTLAKTPEGINTYALAEHLIDKYAIATIPGEAFGETGKRHLRFSFGCLADKELIPAMSALASVNLTDLVL
ncbi:MAG: pyridoxal phosphate-dependent aminotransferase [Candidatus Sabulitectum sp.]|nr:pyridoxal phosphate-dependent aminotransferase [Candidatus Sabulitectum sp.]